MVTREIKLKIGEESDLFSPFDPDRMQLSDEVSAYLVRSYENKHRRNLEDYVIRIFSDAPVNERHVEQALREHCLQQMSNIDHGLKLETIKEVCLAVLGLALLTLWFFLARTHDNIWMEVLSIMGWVAIWEATSIAIMRRPELSFLKKTYRKASKAKIEFVSGGDAAAE